MNNLAVIRHVVTWFDASETRVHLVLSHSIPRRNCLSNVIERPRRLPTVPRQRRSSASYVPNVSACQSLLLLLRLVLPLDFAFAALTRASSFSRLSGRITFTPLWPCSNFVVSLCDSWRLSAVLPPLGQRVLTAHALVGNRYGADLCDHFRFERNGIDSGVNVGLMVLLPKDLFVTLLTLLCSQILFLQHFAWISQATRDLFLSWIMIVLRTISKSPRCWLDRH